MWPKQNKIYIYAQVHVTRMSVSVQDICAFVYAFTSYVVFKLYFHICFLEKMFVMSNYSDHNFLSSMILNLILDWVPKPYVGCSPENVYYSEKKSECRM